MFKLAGDGFHHYKGMASGIAHELSTGRFIAIKKTKPDWQKGRYNVPGGHIELGETSLQTLIREFQEETDLDTRDWPWHQFGKILSHKRQCQVFMFYAALDRIIPGPRTVTEEEISMLQIKGLDLKTMVEPVGELVQLLTHESNIKVSDLLYEVY